MSILSPRLPKENAIIERQCQISDTEYRAARGLRNDFRGDTIRLFRLHRDIDFYAVRFLGPQQAKYGQNLGENRP